MHKAGILIVSLAFFGWSYSKPAQACGSHRTHTQEFVQLMKENPEKGIRFFRDSAKVKDVKYRYYLLSGAFSSNLPPTVICELFFILEGHRAEMLFERKVSFYVKDILRRGERREPQVRAYCTNTVDEELKHIPTREEANAAIEYMIQMFSHE